VLDSLVRPTFLFTGEFYALVSKERTGIERVRAYVACAHGCALLWMSPSRRFHIRGNVRADRRVARDRDGRSLSGVVVGHRGLKTLAVRKRHATCSRRRRGTLPPRLCAGCNTPLGEDTWTRHRQRDRLLRIQAAAHVLAVRRRFHARRRRRHVAWTRLRLSLLVVRLLIQA